ncbi:tyrosine protein phosphatase, partial [bacterium]|nr:tyrosine protein phosphatase [bacterium]
MIDLHTHILPGLDDGAKSMEESIQMVREAFNDGTRIIVASPHLLFGSYDNTPEVINLRVEELRGVVLREKIEMEILPA